jgi:hypothetical protein
MLRKCFGVFSIQKLAKSISKNFAGGRDSGVRNGKFKDGMLSWCSFAH